MTGRKHNALTLRAASGLALLTTLAIGAPAQVMPAELPDGPPAWATPMAERNAALAYYRTWLVHEAALENLQQAMIEVEDPYALGEASPLDALLDEHQDLVADLIEAGMIPEADWEMQFERGVGALLPHLAKVRNSARILCADAVRVLEAGDAEGAALRLAATYGLARHTMPDRVVISSLVSIAIARLADERVEQLLASGMLTAEARDLLLEALGRFEDEDPFFARRSITAEGEMMTLWIRENFKGKTAGAELLNELVVMGGTDDGLAGRLTNPVFYADGPALEAELRRMLAFYRDMVSLWDEPDATDRLKVLESAIQTGQYGPLAKILAPALSRFQEQTMMAEVQQAELVRRLKEAPVARGEGQGE